MNNRKVCREEPLSGETGDDAEPSIDHLEAIIDQLSAQGLFSTRTIALMKFDMLRVKARLERRKDDNIRPAFRKLHLGSGTRSVPGWLNVDIHQSDYNVDLACGRLPWESHSFDSVVSQHLIEHLELIMEFLPLMREIHRVLRPGGEIWLSCPDLERVCRSYVENSMKDLLADIVSRWPSFSLGEIPTSHMANHMFHQNGEHKNLYDFKMLCWALRVSGFVDIRKISESDLLQRFPEFPARGDDLESIYVHAVVTGPEDQCSIDRSRIGLVMD